MKQMKIYTESLGKWIHIGPGTLTINGREDRSVFKSCRSIVWRSTGRPRRADKHYNDWKVGSAFISACAPPPALMTTAINLKASTYDLDLYLYRTPNRTAFLDPHAGLRM